MKLKSDIFYVAYRKRKETILPFAPNNLDDFVIVKNPLFNWCADPFLIKYDDKNYLFCEIATKIGRFGRIGYMCLDDKKPKWKICLKENFHLSFPNIYIKDNKLLMVPESHSTNLISIYKTDGSINKWKKDGEILNMDAVDTSFFGEDTNHFVTYDISKKPFTLKEYKNKTKLNSYIDKDATLRPAGNLIISNDMAILPTQYNTNFYGEKILFRDYKNDLSIISTLEPESLKKHFNSKRIVGTHTYNLNEEFETIDIIKREWTFLGFINKVVEKLKTK